MGKRSDFPRRKMDAYDTPLDPVVPLVQHLKAEGIRTFAEPCVGNLCLLDHLLYLGLHCTYAGDIKTGEDALTIPRRLFASPDAIITNPPWTRSLLHPLILRFQEIAPTWLLFDSDWASCRLAVPYLDQCSHILAVGRVKWIAGSKNTGKDNASWYRFDARHTGGPRFIGRDGVKKPPLPAFQTIERAA
jgi:hypothetical protein